MVAVGVMTFLDNAPIPNLLVLTCNRVAKVLLKPGLFKLRDCAWYGFVLLRA